MAVNTRIQVRRGYSAGYSLGGTEYGNLPVSGNRWIDDTSILYPGEIGYEIDTGKFKIGKDILTPWGSLPYAGGSEIVAQTGIGYTFTNSSNAYSFYSLITGVSGGQQGITFQTLPLSGLLNNTQASGTYYQIGLSDKLENLHDSNITISGNALTSITSGITISGFNNSTISLNPSGGTVTQSGINIRNLTEDVTVTSAIGGLSLGTQLTSASGITAILKQMLQQVFEPSLFSGPSVSFSSFGGVSNNSEIGTTGNLTVNISYSAGRINGTGTGAGWNSSAQQGGRAGGVTSYVISGVNTEASASRTFNNFQLNATSINIPFSANYAAGITALNSIGQASTAPALAPNPLPSGTVSSSTTISSYRGVFYGASSGDSIAPTTSAEIRALSSGPLNLNSLATFTIDIPAGTKKIVVAFPSGTNGSQTFFNTIPDGTWSQAGIKIINGNNSPETYDTTTINVSGANNFTAIPYHVKYYIPSVPVPTGTAHTITIK